VQLTDIIWLGSIAPKGDAPPRPPAPMPGKPPKPAMGFMPAPRPDKVSTEGGQEETIELLVVDYAQTNISHLGCFQCKYMDHGPLLSSHTPSCAFTHDRMQTQPHALTHTHSLCYTPTPFYYQIQHMSLWSSQCVGKPCLSRGQAHSQQRAGQGAPDQLIPLIPGLIPCDSKLYHHHLPAGQV
jgi:hypothetical protein